VWVVGVDSWIHHLRVKGWNSSTNITSPPPDPKLEPASFSCQPLNGLILLFKKKMSADTAKSSSISLLDPKLQYLLASCYSSF
jgi:hypothetical protein